MSFGEDEEGNLYIAYLYDGEVYRIVTGDPLPGDYNYNGVVDAADYTVWRDAMTAGSTSLINRGPNTGAVDEDDFLFWRAHFGESVGGGAAPAGPLQTLASSVELRPCPSQPAFMVAQLLCLMSVGMWYNRK